jgi:hypothetical protein
MIALVFGFLHILETFSCILNNLDKKTLLAFLLGGELIGMRMSILRHGAPRANA